MSRNTLLSILSNNYCYRRVDPKLRPSQKKNLANTKFQAKKLLETWVENHETTEVEI